MSAEGIQPSALPVRAKRLASEQYASANNALHLFWRHANDDIIQTMTLVFIFFKIGQKHRKTRHLLTQNVL